MIIGVVIPAYNEEQYLKACLDSIDIAVEQISIYQQSLQTKKVPIQSNSKKPIQAENAFNIEVQVLVVLDNCDDDSLSIVKNATADYLECAVNSVGIARDLGVRLLIAQGADWIACTDADSTVDRLWLVEQIRAQPADVICGVVDVDRWDALSEKTKHEYTSKYQDCMNHTHIHGANLSFSATAYIESGGFPPIPCHEDVKLVEQMQAMNLNITWTNRVRVTTSSRLDARAPEGFAHFLKAIEFNQS